MMDDVLQIKKINNEHIENIFIYKKYFQCIFADIINKTCERNRSPGSIFSVRFSVLDNN